MNINQTRPTPQAPLLLDSQQTPRLMMDFEKFAQELSLAHQELDWFTESGINPEKKRVQTEQTEKILRRQDQEDDHCAGAACVSYWQRIRQEQAAAEIARVQDLTLDRKNQASAQRTLIDETMVQERSGQQRAQLQSAIQTKKGKSANIAEFAEIMKTETEEPTVVTKAAEPGPVPVDPENLESNSVRKPGSGSTVPSTPSPQPLKGSEMPVRGEMAYPIEPTIGKSVRVNASTAINNPGKTEPITAATASNKTAGLKGVAISATQQTFGPEADKGQSAKPKPGTEAASPKSPVNAKQLENGVRYLISQRKHELTLQLEPEHLGKLVIRLKKDGDKISGLFKVDSVQAKEAIESQIAPLQRSLEEQGIRLERFQVVVNGGESGLSDSAFSHQDGQHSQAQRQSTETGSRISRQDTLWNAGTDTNPVVQQNSESGVNLYA